MTGERDDLREALAAKRMELEVMAADLAAAQVSLGACIDALCSWQPMMGGVSVSSPALWSGLALEVWVCCCNGEGSGCTAWRYAKFLNSASIGLHATVITAAHVVIVLVTFTR